MTTITVRDVHTDSVIVAETCAQCGVVFGLGQRFMDARRNDHQSFYCPNGHSLSYKGPSEAEREAERLRMLLRGAESSARSWRDQAETAEARRRAEKAAKTRLKKRIAAGVCPCCHRSFVGLQQHIARQHPGFEES